MKQTRGKKKSNSKVTVKHEIVELPSENKEMEDYVLTNRIQINQKIVDNIEYALKNKLGGVEMFCFQNSNFIVVLHQKDFKESLESIYDFSMKNEKYEACLRARKVINLLNRYTFSYSCKKTKK